MTVKQLIAALRKFGDPNLEVRLYSDEEGNRINQISRIQSEVLINAEGEPIDGLVIIPKEE